MDYKGFFDRKSLSWKEIDSTVLIAAAAPPGGGRSALTARYFEKSMNSRFSINFYYIFFLFLTRFTRHFSIMTVPDSQVSSLTHIFSSIF